MDSGFYRGTNAEQDGRFTDKEKKLLKTMKFEGILDTKVDLSKVNIEVIKPWITSKLNELMNSEDDVLVEYVFTQLEDRNVNPKIMQINLTGFLNARISREFMAELWQLFVDAQASLDGIPASLVEKKMQQLKTSSSIKTGNSDKNINDSQTSSSLSKAMESDWRNRYHSLTGGRYGKDSFQNFENGREGKNHDRERGKSPLRGGRRDHFYDRDVDRGNRRDYRDRSRDRVREYDRNRRDRERGEKRVIKRSRTKSPPVRRFTEDPVDKAEKKREKDSDKSTDEVENCDHEVRKKKRKKRKHHGSDSEGEPTKKSKKTKKEKKKKRNKDKN